jgi:hypothetical protein
MMICPNGHPNPSGWSLCGECGAPLEGDGGRRYRVVPDQVGAHRSERRRGTGDPGGLRGARDER